MPDAVHWRALNPLDFQPDEWPSDVDRYNRLCHMGHLEIPQDEGQEKQLAETLKNVISRESCERFLFDAL